MDLFDGHCDTVSRCWREGWSLRSNPGNVDLERGGRFGAWGQFFALFAAEEDHPGVALEEVCRAAARLLKTGGRFCLCLPPRRLAEALALLEGAGISPKRLQLVQHRPGRAPFLVLLEGRRGGRPGLEVLPTRMLAGEKEGNG